jgi:predicted HTH domain antitoxin
MLAISDDVLRQTGMSEREARIEIACRLFQAECISLPVAGRIAELERPAMEHELRRRDIAPYKLTVKMLDEDMAAFEE